LGAEITPIKELTGLAAVKWEAQKKKNAKKRDGQEATKQGRHHGEKKEKRGQQLHPSKSAGPQKLLAQKASTTLSMAPTMQVEVNGGGQKMGERTKGDKTKKRMRRNLKVGGGKKSKTGKKGGRQ